MRPAIVLLLQRAQSPSRTAPSTSRRSEEHTSELQSQPNLVCRLLLEKKSHDGALLASTGDDGVVRLWDPARGQAISGFVTGPSSALAWSAARLAVTAERSVIVLDVCE